MGWRIGGKLDLEWGLSGGQVAVVTLLTLSFSTFGAFDIFDTFAIFVILERTLATFAATFGGGAEVALRWR